MSCKFPELHATKMSLTARLCRLHKLRSNPPPNPHDVTHGCGDNQRGEQHQALPQGGADIRPFVANQSGDVQMSEDGEADGCMTAESNRRAETGSGLGIDLEEAHAGGNVGGMQQSNVTGAGLEPEGGQSLDTAWYGLHTGFSKREGRSPIWKWTWNAIHRSGS